MASLSAVPAAVLVWSLLSAALPGGGGGGWHGGAGTHPAHPSTHLTAPHPWVQPWGGCEVPASRAPAGELGDGELCLPGGCLCLSFPPWMGCLGDAPAACPLSALRVQSPQYRCVLGDTEGAHVPSLAVAMAPHSMPLKAGCSRNSKHPVGPLTTHRVPQFPPKARP